ncbi:MAG: NYN domain-containing protein [Deltaproteobacteria bacterium]|nr:NYN domain-containing protein [Deltaproteobacteria bacterium]
MDRTAVFVDAGYLFAAGSRLIAGQKLPRGAFHLDYDAVLNVLNDLVRDLTGLPLLRFYWYDGTATGATPQQLALAYRPNVKLRLGFVNRMGEQKGVDSLIVTDLINLARNHAMADAVLMTGDEDIRVGVQQAQEFGVRVHLIGIEPAGENQSGFLVQEADGVRQLSIDSVQSFLKLVPGFRTSAEESTSSIAASIDSATETPASLASEAERIAGELSREEIAAVLKESSGGGVPADIDRRLLSAGTRATGDFRLTSEQKRTLREAFLAACRRLTTI